MARSPNGIAAVLTDIDGVWTDGGMYYGADGESLKKFSTYDSAGVVFCKANDLPIVILTGESTPFAIHRAQKLGISQVYTGVTDKLQVATEALAALRLSPSDAAYIGDSIADIPLLMKVGFAATTPSAPGYVTRHADYITRRDGGEGAFRDFVEEILRRLGVFEQTVQQLTRAACSLASLETAEVAEPASARFRSE